MDSTTVGNREGCCLLKSDPGVLGTGTAGAAPLHLAILSNTVRSCRERAVMLRAAVYRSFLWATSSTPLFYREVLVS